MNAVTQHYAEEVNWPEVQAGNKGPYVCCRDWRFPGGYFISRSKPPHVFFCGNKQDMESLAANIIATLKYYPLLVTSNDEGSFAKDAIKATRSILQKELSKGISDYYPHLAYMSSVLALADTILIHPRAPAVDLRLPVASVPVTFQEYKKMAAPEGNRLDLRV